MPTMRMTGKTSPRAAAKKLKLKRLKSRRRAVKELNTLVSELSLSLPALRPKAPDAALLGKVLRTLSKRCRDDEKTRRFAAAVRQFTQHGGALPDGMELCPMDAGQPGEPSAVPRHKILQTAFRLKSKAFMLTFHSESFDTSSWEPFLAHIRSVAANFGARTWAACLERSENSQLCATAGERYHCHAYFIWTDGAGIMIRGLDAFEFQGSRPRVDVCVARGRSSLPGAPCRQALHGHWYVEVNKMGTCFADTNYKAWRDYTPSVAWLNGLWDSRKLGHDQYLALSVKFRTGHAKRKRDVLEVQRDEYESAVAEHALRESDALDIAQPLCKLRAFPEIDAFVESFKAPDRRRPVLVLVGGSNSGKSLLAADALRRIGKVLGLQEFVEVTVEADDALDFSAFDHRRHSGVLLDGVGDVATLWKSREILQGRPKVTRGGRSATMRYSYPYTLARRAIVVTLDLTALRLDWLRTNHWLRNPSNVCLLRLTEAAWERVQPPVAAAPASPSDEMRAWTVTEVCFFYGQQDAAGLTTVLEQNAVNGADLLSFTSPADLCADLCMTPLAARKALRLRDAFLRNEISMF